VSTLDKKLKEEIKDTQKYKLAEGVKMVEYDIFGFPKTKEMEQLKKQLGLNAQIEEEVEGNFIANPEWKQRYGVNKDYDIEEEDMDEETRELNRFLEEDEDVEENEEIDANFIK